MTPLLEGIEKSLCESTSIESVHKLSDHLMHFLQGECSSQERKEALRLLKSCEKKRQEYWELDGQIARLLSDLGVRAEQARYYIEQRTFAENAQLLNRLYYALSLIERVAIGRSHFLDTALKECFHKICRYDFAHKNPEILLFDLGSCEKNIAHLLKELEEAFFLDNPTSQLLWVQLPHNLRKGIEQGAKDLFGKVFSGLAGGEKAYVISCFFQDLQRVVHFCETFFHLSKSESLYEMRLMPLRIQEAFLAGKGEEESFGQGAVRYLQTLID
ncbi:MAG: hypothetical protein AAGF04_01700 [Chlamydiota bacterium]